MNDPLVSVVIPCFNGAEFLQDCVRSVLDQDTSCEIIVVDDESTDATCETARKLLRELPARMVVLSQKNCGPAAARNAGLALARGRYVCFLDVDDRFAPGFFATTVPILEKDPTIDGVFCEIELVNSHRAVEPWHFDAIERTLPGNILTRTELVRQMGGFPDHPAFRGKAAGEDGVFRNELRRRGRVVKIDKKLYKYYVRPGSHFDYFLDRAYVEDGKIEFRDLSKEESDGSLKSAIRGYRDSVQDRLQTKTLETLRTSIKSSFEFHSLSERFKNVDGYLHPAEGFTLYSLARTWPGNGTTVEIGSFKGRSTCWLAAGCRDSRRSKVVAIDHFCGSPEHQPNNSHADRDLAAEGSTLPAFRRNLEEQKLADFVTVLVGSSVEASKGWDEPIRLLFIDGEHSAAAVRQDFETWSPFVVRRGLVAFHDVGVFADVTQFYGELCSPGSGWKELARFHSLGILQRIGNKETSRAGKLEAEALRLQDFLDRHPEEVDSLFRLAQVRERQKSWDEAIATYERLLRISPDHADAHNLLGILLARRQEFDQAMDHFRTFLQLKPDRAAGYHNLGVACADQDKTVEALPYFEEALRLDPDRADAHKGKGMALLKLGRFTEGWAEYEWRWRCKDLAPLRSPQPVWDGSPLHGRTILLHSEQGFGDTIQFVRYAALVKESGGTVILACQPQLMTVLRTCAGIDHFVSRKSALPPHDVHIPLLSVPRALGTELASIPGNCPYVFADADRFESWRKQLADVAGLKVGIVWQGNPEHVNDVNRSIPLRQFQPLAKVPGVHLFSVQVGTGSEQLEQLAQLSEPFTVTDLRQRIAAEFAETAAALANLDLVISCDTSVAHLAGALGVPVWVALPLAADWRWLQQREDNPWYPTMRLFRQKQARNWPEVFERIAEALRFEVDKPRSPRSFVSAPAQPQSTLSNNDEVHYSLHAENEPATSSPAYAPNSPVEFAQPPSESSAYPGLSLKVSQAQELMQSRKHSQAEQLLRQAVAANPADADPWLQLALAQQAQNRLSDAVASFRQFLSLRPDHAEGHVSMGIALCRLGERQQGEASLREAIRLQPNLPKAHYNLGVVLSEQGKKSEGLASWQEAVRLDPNYPEANLNLAVALAENKRPEEAVRHYERVLQLRPDCAEAYNNLGLLHVEHGRPAVAVVLLEHAIRLKPGYFDAHNNLGLALADLGRCEEALACFREALRLRPSNADFYSNYGTALASMGRDDEALACYDQALRLRRDYPEAHWHQALSWLRQGDMARGWPEYEGRWKRKRSRPRHFREPLWDGSDLTGKTIFLWCEQGLGDSIQFIRYAPLVKTRGGKVVVECPQKLSALLATCAGIDQLVPQESQLPPFDVQAPLLSLPGIFGTRLHSIPADVPYLSADVTRVARWRDEFAAMAPKFRIGIVWQGNPAHRWDRHRSFSLEYFEPLARLEGVQLFSLQKGVPSEDLVHFSRRHGLIDLADRLEDFTDTAAVMKNLDLVISCDSAPAHLAGALGVPVWLPMSTMSDWRWMKTREDCPWYPTLRLFRQERLGKWRQVFRRIVEEVHGILVKRKLQGNP